MQCTVDESTGETALGRGAAVKAVRRARSFGALVALFTLAAAALLWWQSSQSQALLRQQVLQQSEQRSLQLADAMAGQVQAQLDVLDASLKQLRDGWVSGNRARFHALASEALAVLPAGMVSHVSVVNAQGYLVYNSLGLDTGIYVGDRSHFKALRSGGDGLRVAAPVRSRLLDKWIFTASRPILRDGIFQGGVYILVNTAFFADRLGALALSDLDVVSLVHPDGRYLARSLDNEAAMGLSAPPSRPYLVQLAEQRGFYRVAADGDHVARTYGWQRLPASALVVSIGLADASVLEPLAPALQRSQWVAGVLSLLLLGFGAVIVRDQLRAARDQRALASSEARLKEAQRLAQLGSWSLDLVTQKLEWSDEVFRILGLDPAVTVPTYETYLDALHPDDREHVREAYDTAVREHKSYNVVHRLHTPDGKVKYVRELCTTEYRDDQPLRSVGTLQDITEVRKVRVALQQLNEQLEVRVSERTSELVALNRELEAFTYSVSHDLRTPLRSIHGFACVLEEDEAEHLSASGRQHLRRIQDGSRRMGQLITDLLSLAHLNRADMHHERVDLSGLAHAVVTELEVADPQRKVTWHIEDGLTAMADPGLLRVVLHNLLGNAWKYTSQTPNAQIGLTADRRDGAMTEFCVRDNGVGFDMGYEAQLFQPFKRLHAHHEFEGSGVGLATVKRVVQRHGGSVRAEGAVGEGAAVYFSLPELPVAADLAA